MKLSCASVCYRGYAENEVGAMLEHAPKAGFEYVDIHGPLTWSPEAIDALDADYWRERVEAVGMRCTGIYTPGFGGANDEQARRHADAIAKAIALCARLGGSHVVSTGATSRRDGDLSRVIACVERIVSLLPDDNAVTIGLEPHYGNVIGQLSDYERILSAVNHPRVGVCVDTGHFHAAGVDTVGLIRRFGNRIVDVHLKDHIGTQSVAIGRGEIDLPRVFDALREVGYDGTVTLELEVSDTENAPRYVEEAFAAMRDLAK